MCVCVRVCMHTGGWMRACVRGVHPQATAAFQFLYMTVAMDITDGFGLSNEACHESLSKNSNVMLYLPFISW